MTTPTRPEDERIEWSRTSGARGVGLGVLLVLLLATCADAGSADPPGDLPTPTVSAAVDTSSSSTAAHTEMPADADQPEPSPSAPSSPTGSAGDAGCSAEGLGSAVASDPRLPHAVTATRRRIVKLAVECDFDALAALTAESFVYSFGGGDDPAAYWRAAEGYGYQPLRTLAQLLKGPAELQHGVWQWPPDAGAGPRVGIEPDGSWAWYVAGD